MQVLAKNLAGRDVRWKH